MRQPSNFVATLRRMEKQAKAPYRARPQNLIELAWSLSGPRPQLLGIKPIKIGATIYPVRVYESLEELRRRMGELS